MGRPARSGPVPWAANFRDASQKEAEGQSALSGPSRNEAPSEGFALRRQMLSEMRLLQPFRYAELATEPVGLLNRSVQELSILVQAARNRPEGSGEPEANLRPRGVLWEAGEWPRPRSGASSSFGFQAAQSGHIHDMPFHLCAVPCFL